MKKANSKTGENASNAKASKIVRVNALVQFGVPISEACRREGLARATYYRSQPAQDAA